VVWLFTWLFDEILQYPPIKTSGNSNPSRIQSESSGSNYQLPIDYFDQILTITLLPIEVTMNLSIGTFLEKLSTTATSYYLVFAIYRGFKDQFPRQVSLQPKKDDVFS
jgi:hypothetical protein